MISSHRLKFCLELFCWLNENFPWFRSKDEQQAKQMKKYFQNDFHVIMTYGLWTCQPQLIVWVNCYLVRLRKKTKIQFHETIYNVANENGEPNILFTTSGRKYTVQIMFIWSPQKNTTGTKRSRRIVNYYHDFWRMIFLQFVYTVGCMRYRSNAMNWRIFISFIKFKCLITECNKPLSVCFILRVFRMVFCVSFVCSLMRS